MNILSDIFGDTTASDKKRPPAADQKLIKIQQEQLRRQRYQLKTHIDDAHQTFEATILGQTHIGTFATLWPCWSAIAELSSKQHRNIVVTLSGKNQQPTSSQEPLPLDLNSMLSDYTAYIFVLERISAIPNLRENQKEFEFECERLEKYVSNHRDLFGSIPRTSDLALETHLQRHCEQRASQLLSLIKHKLCFLGDRTFLFLPQAKDARAGWNSFWSFVSKYSVLPLDIVEQHGPYYWMAWRGTPKGP